MYVHSLLYEHQDQVPLCAAMLGKAHLLASSIGDNLVGLKCSMGFFPSHAVIPAISGLQNPNLGFTYSSSKGRSILGKHPS